MAPIETRARPTGARMGSRWPWSSCTTEMMRWSISIPKVAMATDCTSRAICFGLFSALARMCSSLGRPISSATIRAAFTAGSRQSSFSMTASSVSSTTPNHTHAVSGKHMGRSGVSQPPAHFCQPSVNSHSIARYDYGRMRPAAYSLHRVT